MALRGELLAALAFGDDEARPLANKLSIRKIATYRKTLQTLATLHGLDKPVLSSRLLQDLYAEATRDAESIIATHNARLPVLVDRALALEPDDPQAALAIIEELLHDRAEAHGPTIAITSLYGPHADATIGFYLNAGAHPMFDFGGHGDADPACELCQAILDLNPHPAARVIEIGTPHHQCFPPETLVRSGDVDSVTERRYDGEVVVLHTADGVRLAVTPNHPVLTGRGWTPAVAVSEADYLLRARGADGERGLRADPDEAERPTMIGELAASLPVALGGVPVAAEDFHGDVPADGEVHVVRADRLLLHDRLAALAQTVVQHDLVGADVPGRQAVERGALARLRAGLALLDGVPTAARGVMGALDTGSPFAHRDALTAQHVSDGARRASHALGDEGARPELGVERGARRRVDYSPTSGTALCDRHARLLERRGQDVSAGPGAGRDLPDRLASLVAADHVVKVERVAYSGHVYNLSTGRGWYRAEGFIVANCAQQWHPVGDVEIPASYVPGVGGTAGIVGTRTLERRWGSRKAAIAALQRME